MPVFKFFFIIFPQPITQFFPIVILFEIIEPDPIKVLSPIEQLLTISKWIKPLRFF